MSFYVSLDQGKSPSRTEPNSGGPSEPSVHNRVQAQYDAMRPQPHGTLSDAPAEFFTRFTVGLPDGPVEHIRIKPKVDKSLLAHSVPLWVGKRNDQPANFVQTNAQSHSGEDPGSGVDDMMMFPMDPIEGPSETHDAH